MGIWHYPTPDIALSGYWETLTIRSDGTFTKHQQDRIGSETYGGTYSVAEDGLVTFHVTSKQYDNGSVPSQIKLFNVDAVFRLRVAVDSQGNLIVADLNPFTSTGVRVIMPEDVDVAWYCCYTSMTHGAQSDAMMKRLMEMVQTTDNAK